MNIFSKPEMVEKVQRSACSASSLQKMYLRSSQRSTSFHWPLWPLGPGAWWLGLKPQLYRQHFHRRTPCPFICPAFTLFSHLAEAPVPTLAGLSVCPASRGLSFSPRQLIQLHYTPHTLTSLASTQTLPIPNSGSIQHSVYSASLSKLPDTPVENQTIVLIGAVTNSSVFSSAEHPLPPLPCAL